MSVTNVSNFAPALPITTKVAVIGAGAMGSGIAQVAAQAGHQVFLYDQQVTAAAKGKEGISTLLRRRVARGKMTAAELAAVLERILPVNQLEEVAAAGLVIEAIVEDLAIKRRLFAQLEEICGADAILATNTSSISVTALGAELQRPERLVGMHFFNPAPVMALVEVVSGLATADQVAQTIYATAAAWGKKPVMAASTPGFIVNRVARPFYAESLRLLQEQTASPATLDAVLREAGGFRMGPFELMDLIGQDVNYAVTESVFQAYYGDFRFQPSLIQKELVAAGRLGRKSGQGFYSYAAEASPMQPASQPPAKSVARQVVIEGDLGAAAALIPRLAATGLEIVQQEGPGRIIFGAATLALTDGRMASERSSVEGWPQLVLFDLALDYSQASRLALAAAPSTSEAAIQDAVALLQLAGMQVSLLADAPGLVVMRTLAMLANTAADAVLHGVASAEDVDLAMCAGVNYPQGPLSWSQRLGPTLVWQVLQNLQASYGEDRYRPSLFLRRLALAG